VGATEVPERARSVIEQRLARLSPEARDALHTASVLGRTFTFDRLLAVTGRSEEETERALDEGVRAGVVLTRKGDEYAFGHALTQQALYEDLTPRRRRRVHLAVAAALEREDGPPGVGDGSRTGRAAEIAWHLLQADAPARALPYAVAAGDEAEAVFAHGEAERLYRMALDILFEIGAGDERAEESEADVLERLGGVLRTLARYDDALEYLERAAQIYGEAGDTEGERRVMAQIGTIYALTDRADEGIARLEPMIVASPGEPAEPDVATEGTRQETSASVPVSRAVGSLHLSLALLQLAADNPAGSLAASERASGIARTLDDERLLADAEARRGEALAVLGRHDEARRVLEAIVPLAERHDLRSLIRALSVIGIACAHAGEIEQARLYTARALELAERLRDPRSVAGMNYYLGRTLYLLGRWDEAIDHLRTAVDRAGSVSMPRAFAIDIDLGHILGARGQWDEAAGLLQRAATTARAVPADDVAAMAQAQLAEIALLRGHPRAAHVLLGSVQGDLESVDSLLSPLLVLARTRMAMGDVDGADEMAVTLAARAAATHNRVQFAETLGLQAEIRVRQGRMLESVHLFTAARALARRMPLPYLEARVLLAWGGVAGDASRVHLEEALHIFQRLGAAPWVEMAESSLSARAL
jgi:tetratricopeptide (TPR) repeat protein